MIEVRSLRKTFGKVTAVEDVSFSAPDGQVTGLLGPNGAGKTTTLRLLYGLLRPDDGSASVGGTSVAADALAARGRMGVLTDAPGLYARLTPREHLRYSAELHGLRGARRDEAVAAQLAAFGLAELADRRTAGFSLGERRKVALARALVHDPAHVLLDEPTNGLDVPSARAVRRRIQELAARGKCVVLSSHLMHEVSQLCDRIVVVARGRVVAEGSPAELLAASGAADLESAFVRWIGSEEGLG